jgi:hypothetical protein
MSLKDALAKAGIKSSKTENDRKYKKQKIQSEKNQETRIFCELCETTQQDVERYKHNNALIDAEWICSNRADKSSIHDDCRQTQQSTAAKAGSFRRYYGPLKVFEKTGEKPKANNPRYKGKNPSRSNQNKRNDGNSKTADKKKNYTIDDDGEKNFNC